MINWIFNIYFVSMVSADNMVEESVVSKMQPAARMLSDSTMLYGIHDVYTQRIWFCYGLATGLAILCLYFFLRAQGLLEVDSKKKYFFLGLAFFVIALLLWMLPSYFSLQNGFSGGFDPRTT